MKDRFQNVQVGILFFDNIGEPKVKMEIGAFGRKSDLETAILNLHKIPCGSSWCKEKTNSNQEVSY